jgi:hypothetical protein
MAESAHPILSPKKLIEVALPLDAINAAAAREKTIRHGHPSTLHLWWARRPLAAARRLEESQGCHVVDVSAHKCGWDLTSYPPAVDDRQPEPRHIEVKGRVKGAATITVTRNEVLYAFNQGDKFVLAIVLVNGDDSFEGPIYIRRPFDREPGWGVSSLNYDLQELLRRSESRVRS